VHICFADYVLYVYKYIRTPKMSYIVRVQLVLFIERRIENSLLRI